MSTQANELTFETIKQESPLVNFENPQAIVNYGDAITIREEAFVHQYVVRLKQSNESLIASVKQLLGVSLPLEMNRVEANQELLVCMNSPDEWLIIDRSEKAKNHIAELVKLFESEFALVSEITGGQTMLHLTGLNVRDVLSKGMVFDTHPTVFSLGQCAQVVMAQAPMLLVPVTNDLGKPQNFLLVIRRSFSDHIAAWLQDASLEFMDTSDHS